MPYFVYIIQSLKDDAYNETKRRKSKDYIDRLVRTSRPWGGKVTSFPPEGGIPAIFTISLLPSPAALFVYFDTRLKMSLKNEIWEKINKDLGALVNKYGGLGPEYFSKVRRLSIQYWKDLDRRNIFDETLQ